MDSIETIKKRFIAIIAVLSLFFIINALYFNGLYHTIREETVRMALQSIEDADIDELQNRMDAVSCLQDNENYIDNTDTQIDNTDHRIGNTVEVADSSKNSIRGMMSELMKELRLSIHQTIDFILPIDLLQFDSLVVSNFKNKGISAKLFYSEIVDLKTGTVMASSRPATARTRTGFYMFEYDTGNRYAYKVYTSSLTGDVLKQMFSILATTFLTIVLLSYAFVYFIRIVIRQKTLEEMKRDFTNNMTHELNTPISVAYSAVDTLLNFKQGENREKTRQYLNICMEQLSCLRDLVEHILSMSMDKSKNITMHKDQVEIKQMLTQIAGQQKLKTEKRMDIDLIVLPENLTVHADRTHLHNVVNNLMDNAVKYSSDQVKINIQSYVDKDCCVISIKDNGIGISKENQKYIFDRFYRIPQGNLHNIKGYGLGLFYVKTIVEQHNGEITVKSTVNKGAEFIIKIPVK